MYKSIIATSALAAGAAAYGAVGSSSISPGNAKVVNGCKYDVYVSNTPAADGGYSAIDKTLSPGDSYSQEFTMLSNLMGWSIKLSKDGNFGSNILQYEYTYLQQDNIWFDLSEVNGNPWDGNWEITSAGDCSPRQAAYRFATDDAYGMQDCPANSDITVLLCSGESQADGLASAVASGSAPSSTALPSAPETSAAAAAAPAAASPTFLNEGNFHNAQVQNTPVASSSSQVVETPTATTLITQAAAPQGVVVTEYATVVVTEIATATHYARDQHAHRHVHRHPHARA